MDDSEIIRLFFDRSEQAIALTREKYGPYCAAIAYRILSSIEDTEECVNDTWQRAWEAIPPAQPADLRAYLGRITRNLSLTRLRETRAVKRGGTSVQLALEELGECVSAGDTPEDEMLRRQLAEAVNRFLQTLPGKNGRCSCCATGTCTPARRSPEEPASARPRCAPCCSAFAGN